MMKPSPIELLQDAGEALLGDLQDFEQFGDPEAGIAVHEMQDAVMGAPEAVLREHGIGIAGEIAVGEKQKLDAGNEIDLPRAILAIVGATRLG